jgi:dTDP-6-deoxy-L-talose 4-dehydrogenase (NAD+)
MKVIVTGVTGFIGKYVVPYLLKGGCEVIALSRSTENANVYNNEKFFVAKYEIGSNEKIDEELIKDADVLLHLAWSHVNDINSDEHLNYNLPVHYNFIKQVVELGVENILVSGSCYEYGACEGAVSEQHPTNPLTAYGVAKDRLRLKLESLSSDVSFNLTWARLFYIYGEGQVSTSIYSQLMSALDNGESVFNMSQGDQQLDYLPVKEVAEIIVKLSLMQENIGCVNICKGEPITLRTLVEYWISKKGGDIKLLLGIYPYRDYEPKCFWGDRSYLNETLKQTYNGEFCNE